MTETPRQDGDSEERERRERRERRRRARKERVLHTRISEELSEDIRRMADELRVPVSNIVRNVLEEAFSVVETVTDNVGDLIEDVVDEAEAAAERIRRRKRRHRPGAAPHRRAEWLDEEPLDVEPERESKREPESEPERPGTRQAPDDVLGWQPMVLAREQSCSDCGMSLAKGANAYAAVTSRGIGTSYVCEDCLSDRA